MKRYHVITMNLAILLVMITSACSGQGQEEEWNMEPLSVIFSYQPETPAAGSEVELSVEVLQGDEKVDDASDVQFEIWPEGVDDHQFVPAEAKGEGVYSLNWTFDEPGRYYVMYHVTARDFHSMERMEINVE